MSVFSDLSSDEIHKLGQDAFTAYLDAAFEARKRHNAIDGFLVPAWRAAIQVIVGHLESWGYVRPKLTPITGWRHGSIYAYQQMGCRCTYCRQAGMAYSNADNDNLNLKLSTGVAYDPDNYELFTQPEPGTSEAKSAIY